MIAVLSGRVSEKVGEVIVVDCGGIGYGVLVTFEDFGSLNTGDETKLYIYEHIRETEHSLFGFKNLQTKQLFEQLLSVNGVGPKMALAILSIAGSSQVRQAIAGGDTKFISQANGVGKRVAQMMKHCRDWWRWVTQSRMLPKPLKISTKNYLPPTASERL
jgi:Holliday junction DNA helicase RuvA